LLVVGWDAERDHGTAVLRPPRVPRPVGIRRVIPRHFKPLPDSAADGDTRSTGVSPKSGTCSLFKGPHSCFARPGNGGTLRFQESRKRRMVRVAEYGPHAAQSAVTRASTDSSTLIALPRGP